MATVSWSFNGGRLNSYRAQVGNHTWALTLKAVGWVMESLTAPSMSPEFVAPVTVDADVAMEKAERKARRVA